MKVLIVAAAIVALAVPSGAKQLTTKNVHGYLGVGGSFPTGGLSSSWNIGFHAQAGVGIKVGTQVELVPALGIHSLGTKRGGSYLSGGTFRPVMLGCDFKYALSPWRPQTGPFVLGGVGIGSPWAGSKRMNGVGQPYYQVGFGVDINTSQQLALSLSIRYVELKLSSGSATWVPITVALKF